MRTEPPQRDLFPRERADAGSIAVNARCLVRTEDEHRVVLVAGMPIAHYAVGDGMAEAHAMVSLIEQGWADQNEVAQAFGRATRSVRRYQRRFEDGGLAALGRPGGYPAGRPRTDRAQTRLVHRLRSEGHSLRTIAARIGVSEKAIRKQLRRQGWPASLPAQPGLPMPGLGADPNLSGSGGRADEAAGRPSPAADPNLSGSDGAGDEGTAGRPSPAADPNLSGSDVAGDGETAGGPPPAADPNLSGSDVAGDDEPLAVSADLDPANRSSDRLLAALGLLDDAAPLFRDGEHVARAGVLLALPAIAAIGVVDTARDVYGSIGPAFYGLRTTMVALVFMALLRIKRPEALKEHAPPELGRLLGLDRAPEVKTLRRKLTRLAGFGRATDFGRRLAQRRVRAVGDAMGFRGSSPGISRVIERHYLRGPSVFGEACTRRRGVVDDRLGPPHGRAPRTAVAALHGAGPARVAAAGRINPGPGGVS